MEGVSMGNCNRYFGGNFNGKIYIMKNEITELIEAIEDDILLFEDTWSRDPQGALKDFLIRHNKKRDHSDTVDFAKHLEAFAQWMFHKDCKELYSLDGVGYWSFKPHGEYDQEERTLADIVGLYVKQNIQSYPIISDKYPITQDGESNQKYISENRESAGNNNTEPAESEIKYSSLPPDWIYKENEDLRMMIGQIKFMKSNMVAFVIYVQDQIKNKTPHSNDIQYMIEDFCPQFGAIRIDETYTKKQLGDFALWFHKWMEGDSVFVSDMDETIMEWEADPDINKL